MMTRRALLRSAAVLPVAGCQFLQTVADTDMTKVAADIGTISGAVTAVENTIKSLQAVPPGVVSAVTGFIDDVRARAASVTAAVSKVASQPVVTRIEDDISAAFKMVAPYVPATTQGVFADALTVLGAVKSVVGLASLIPLAPDVAAVEAARSRLRVVAGR